MSGHTEGPWEVSREMLAPRHINGIWTPSGDHVATFLVPFADSMRVKDVDAHLMAASPDLLEACEAAMRIESLWMPPGDVGPEHEGEAVALSVMRDYLRAAIAKATGEQG